MTEVRVLSSAGVTRPRRSYDPVRTPPGPSPTAMSKPRPPTARVSPDYPFHPSRVPRPIPRRIEWLRVSIASPSVLPSPFRGRVGIRISSFRGLLRLHSRCSPLDRSTAQGGLCHEASIQPVAQPNRSSATRSIDNFLGGTYLHWSNAPSGRTSKTKVFQTGLLSSQLIPTNSRAKSSANSDAFRPPIPISFRPAFRFEAGHHSEMKPAC
jgi:hypothetical protein